MTLLALVVALPSMLVADGGPVLVLGVIALLAFVALGSIAVGSGAASVAARDEDG
jgi:hypothetical protein